MPRMAQGWRRRVLQVGAAWSQGEGASGAAGLGLINFRFPNVSTTMRGTHVNQQQLGAAAGGNRRPAQLPPAGAGAAPTLDRSVAFDSTHVKGADGHLMLFDTGASGKMAGV